LDINQEKHLDILIKKLLNKIFKTANNKENLRIIGEI
jgi:hypothetical protein